MFLSEGQDDKLANMCKSIRRILLLFCLVLLTACSSPAQRLDALALSSGFERGVASGKPYQHVTYQRTSGAKRLHVYLEGDGAPWWSRYIVAQDPTSRRSLALKLMALDEGDTFYLARPCYHGFARAKRCNNSMWTSKRYSRAVVDSMAAALKTHIKKYDYQTVGLIGHSGGGTLAMLLAERVPQVNAVLTVAANMDIDAWTRLHAYSPLSGSLNPALRPPLPADIWQLHLAGSEDKNVPPAIIRGAVRQQRYADVVTFSGFNHSCCWQDAWPDVLTALEEQNAARLKAKYSLP